MNRPRVEPLPGSFSKKPESWVLVLLLTITFSVPKGRFPRRGIFPFLGALNAFIDLRRPPKQFLPGRTPSLYQNLHSPSFFPPFPACRVRCRLTIGLRPRLGAFKGVPGECHRFFPFFRLICSAVSRGKYYPLFTRIPFQLLFSLLMFQGMTFFFFF